MSRPNSMPAAPARPMSLAFYKAGRLMCNFIKFQCIKEVVLNAERVDRPGGFLLACTHISHLEPIVVASAMRRHVRWMARVEFYQKWWGAALLHKGGAFPVDRYGFTLPAVRRAIELASEGNVVGVFPEGGVAKGRDSLLRGGTLKQGVCTIALRTGLPIVPVVVLGTQHLNRVGPWIPPRRARLYMAFGNDVAPPTGHVPSPSVNRAARQRLAEDLRGEFQATLVGLLSHAGLTEGDVP